MVPGSGKKIVKIHFRSNLRWQLDGAKIRHLNRNNSTADCSTALKFGESSVNGACGIVECVCSCVMGLVSKAKNDYHNCYYLI